MRQRTHELISTSYWSTINRLIPQQKISLPGSYELDTVNWIQVLLGVGMVWWCAPLYLRAPARGAADFPP